MTEYSSLEKRSLPSYSTKDVGLWAREMALPGKTLVMQAWRPEFDSQSPHKSVKEKTNSPKLSSELPMHTYAHTRPAHTDMDTKYGFKGANVYGSLSPGFF